MRFVVSRNLTEFIRAASTADEVGVGRSYFPNIASRAEVQRRCSSCAIVRVVSCDGDLENANIYLSARIICTNANCII